MASSEEAAKSSPLPKACENCRIRKIRCNRGNPCSNCSSSGITCRPSSKPTEHRPRMIVSNHYEKQIERIHERLSGIESALKAVHITQSSSTSPQSHTSSQHINHHATITTPNQFEGDSSFRHQSVRASEVARSLDTKNNGDLSNAIDTLKDVINTKDVSLSTTHVVHFSTAENRTRGPQMEALPADLVIKVLSRIREQFPMTFYNYSFENDGYLERLCQRVYFPTESVTLGEMTSMYGLLWLALEEYVLFGDTITKEFDCDKYVKICEKNFFAGIETYDLLAEPSFDNAFALMLGASKAQDDGKTVLCWSLSSAAARHLQSLGYHREAALKNDSLSIAEQKRHLFWTVYAIEKNLALNLGRASSLPDWDIDVKMFQVSTDPAVRPWNLGSIIFVELSRLQGQIYEQLYSASASGKSQAERAIIIEGLSTKLDQVYGGISKLDKDAAAWSEMFKLWTEACDVGYYSLLTLLHRAATNPDDGTEISSKCFEAARMCLKSHLHFFPMFTQQGEAVTNGYVNWVLLYCSFTPYIVVFLHAIASYSLDDVKLLRDMTASLEPVHTYSAILNRLFDVCRVFSRVAEAIVHARHHHLQQQQHHQQQQQHPTSYPNTTGASHAHTASTPAQTLGSYDHQTDSLFFPGFTGHHGFDPGHQQLPDIFMQGSSMDPAGSNMNMNDMSAYFGNWVSSNQPSMDLFSMDFGGNM